MLMIAMEITSALSALSWAYVLYRNFGGLRRMISGRSKGLDGLWCAFGVDALMVLSFQVRWLALAGSDTIYLALKIFSLGSAIFTIWMIHRHKALFHE